MADTAKMKELIDTLAAERRLDPAGYAMLLESPDEQVTEYAAMRALEVTQSIFGRGIYIRGLIEVTNYCRNNCYYCGIRRGNPNVDRYRLTREEILECCRVGHGLGFRTFVLQGGEDGGAYDKEITATVSDIRREFPDCAITLSLGERSREAYRAFFDAGANRYLLRHETANRQHYGILHPAEMSFDSRMEALRALKEIGYQVGTGMMVGSPGQSIGNLVEDLLFIESFEPEMIGIGPYLPQCDTPFAAEAPGSMPRTLLLISMLRLMHPHSLIPSTTSLATIASEGREKGILAGANVVMPNLSPEEYRGSYALYDNKRSFGTEAAEGLAMLEEQLETIGYHISYDRGDHEKHRKTNEE